MTGEKAREKKLQEDELVHIISPQLVQCKRCSTEIKLSKKSQFDTFHWYQHRERCLKKPVPEVQKVREDSSVVVFDTFLNSNIVPPSGAFTLILAGGFKDPH